MNLRDVCSRPHDPIMIRARIPADANAARTGRLPSIVLVPRLVRAPAFGLDWMLESNFTRWMEDAVARGVRFDDPRLLLDPVDSAADQRPRVVLVFDQLRATAYERVLPWLHDQGIPFAACVATARVGRATGGRFGGERVPSWRELGAMIAVGAVLGTRGHHDVDHGSLAPEQAFHDLTLARREIESRLGTSPWLVRYPAGRASAATASLAAQIGYRVGLCPASPARSLGDPLRWPVARPRPWQKPKSVWNPATAILSARS